MASSITFNFLSSGGPALSREFRSVGDTAAAAARGARVLQDTISRLGTKENRTAEESARLAKALRLTGDAEDRAAAKALAADIAIRRLADAEREAARDSDTAWSRVSRLGKALQGLHGPGLAGGAALLSPALIPVLASALPVIGSVTASLGGAGIAAGGFAALAKTAFAGAGADATKLAALQARLSNATTAKQRQAIQAQIADLEKGWSTSYTQLVTATGKVKTQWSSLATSVATPVLAPWMAAAAAGLTRLRPLVQPVADLFRFWGQSIDRYFASRAGSAEVGRIATGLGRFGAQQMAEIASFLKNFVAGVASLGRDLAANGADFGAFGEHLVKWGTAFRHWSDSAAARKDVSGFLNYVHQNGPVISDLLRNLGTFLAKFAPGLASAGQLELKVISGFLGFVNKLPPGLAKPLIDTAGALLLLQKTGVVKVGLQILTSGAGAGAAGAAGAAEGAAAGGIMARLLPKGTRLLVRGGVVAFGVAAVVSILRSTPNKGDTGVPGQQGNWWETPFGMPGPKSPKSAGNWLTSWSPYENFITRTIPGWFTAMGSFTTGSWARTQNFLTGSWHQTSREAGSIWGGIAGAVSGAWRTITGTSAAGSRAVLGAFGAAGRSADALRTRNLAPLLGEAGRVGGGIQGLGRIMSQTLTAAQQAAGRASDAFRTRNLVPLLGQVGKVSGGVQGLQRYINALHGKNVSVGAHLSGSGGVQVTPSTGAPGAKNYAVYFKPLARGGAITGGVPGRDSVPGWLMPGEVVVPTSMVRAGAVDHLRGKLPGFASGGLVGNLAADAGADVAAEARASLAGITAAVRKAIAARAAQLNPFAGITGVPSGGKIGAGAAAAQAFAKSILWAYGWGQNQFPPLRTLWNIESGWRWDAQNPRSPAYGIPQADPGYKMASAGADWRTNPATQIRWGLGYIKASYGSPAAALAFETSHHPYWYGGGGLVPGYASGGQVGTQGAAWLRAWQAKRGGGFGAAWGGPSPSTSRSPG